MIFELKKDNGVTPVVDAQVKITGIDGREVNRLLRVNDDGKTDEFEVYTKDSSLTFDQSNKEIPYTSIDAEVRFENDKIVFIEGIQVYSDITSIQEVKFDNRENNFRLVRDKKGKSKKEHIHIKNQSPCIFQEDEHNSNVLDMEDKSIKPITKIDNVCIPEFVTIHIGNLNDNGEIITVPFVDYIKNVSCSCIYPTWKKEAIKSNVYAIVSFALNRVYTDWYKSRGYGFDITSSEKYDQMYVKGRTLFRNVCSIVDEVFNNCIKIKGFNQPFLSKCNNNSSSDRKLSRWGSLNLAEEGLNALDILKKYYGDNIELINILDIGGVLKKYPQRELSKGSSGNDVKFIQKALNKIRKNYTGISRIPEEDGIFGDYTEKAVKDFQRIFNLDRDGIVGGKTWNKIALVYALTKKIFGSDDVEEIYTPSIMKLGSKGENVKKLQEDLNYIFGHYNKFNKLVEDGKYGESTKNAVEEFQKVFGLIVDGIVGKNTLNRIEYVKRNINALHDFIDKQLKPDYISEDVINIENPRNDENKRPFHIPIKLGDIGENVKKIQMELNKLSKYYGFLEKLKEDGIFGSKTHDVIKKFQQKFGLVIDGIFGEESLKKMKILKEALKELKMDKKEDENKTDDNNITRHEFNIDDIEFKSEYSMKFPDFDIEFGCICGYIILVQKYINAIKESGADYFSNLNKLEENGKFCKVVLSDIKDFKIKFGLDNNKKIDKNTWNKLVMEYEKIYRK